ncbi:MAG: DUF2065 domain-containing protein [Alphaproteobacteria bacterium]|nr:DUF2065 domain-containing protein [Alphaproteobacteria bacterium]
MKGFMDAIILLFVIRGISYLLFPQWIQRFVAENIISTPINRLKVFGIFQLAIALIIYIYVSKYVGG